MTDECYCECYNEDPIQAIEMNSEDLFDSESRDRALERIRESNRVTIYGNSVITVNMDLVLFMEEKDDMIIFHLLNNAKITVHKSGDILIEMGDMPKVAFNHKEL